jgi:RNA polymerase sigma-70 factor (ECF subfamily)
MKTFRIYISCPARLIIFALFPILIAAILSCDKNATEPEPDPTLYRSNDRFRVECFVERDAAVLDTILWTLEHNRYRILSNLQHLQMNKVYVYIYPDLESFHRSSTWPDGDDWFVGQCINSNTIRMVSPLNPGPYHSYSSMLLAAVHEFVHAVTNSVNIDLMIHYNWLFEGVACHESAMLPSREFIRGLIINDQIPTIQELHDGALYDYGGYQVAYTIAEFVVHDYGCDTMAEFIRYPSDYSRVFGGNMNRYRFENAWRDFLDQHYL